MTDPWPAITRDHGPKAVMSPHITEAEFEAETARQEKVIFPLIANRLTGLERTALDFGCGAGRFTKPLNRLLRPPSITIGYDPCREMLDHAPPILGVSWESGPPDLLFFRNPGAFDIVFIAMVLCLPHVDIEATAEGLARVMSPGGLLVVVDHMAAAQPEGKWARFRPQSFYVRLFEAFGIGLTEIGKDRQLQNPIQILCGIKH